MIRSPLLTLLCCTLLAGCPSKKPTVEPRGTSEPVEPDEPKKAPPEKNVEPQCTGPRQCIVGPNGCCPACLNHDLSVLKAFTRQVYQKHQKKCAASKVESACPKCAAGTGQDSNFIAFCRDEKCVALDIRKSSYSACEKDDECELHGTGCCSCNSWATPVALSSKHSREFRKANCGNMRCAACRRRIWYKGLKARCKDGHCVVEGTWNKKAEGIPASR